MEDIVSARPDGGWLPADKGKSTEASFLKFADKAGIKDAFYSMDLPLPIPTFPEKPLKRAG